MTAQSNFFICSIAILVFAIINYDIGPIINKKVGTNWATNSCKKIKDDYYKDKADNPNMSKEDKDDWDFQISECNNKRAMHNMEYTSVTFNAIISFIGIFLAAQKTLFPKTGLVGMGCGIVGFLLTFIYVIYNGVVYTHYYDRASIYKTDGNGAVAELKGDKYKCFFFNKVNDTRSIIAKYSDLIKSRYNYDLKLQNSFEDDYEKKGCKLNSLKIDDCGRSEFIIGKKTYYDKEYEQHDCTKLFYQNTAYDNNQNYDKSARFLTCLLLSIFTLLCYCGFIFSSFKLFKESS